MNFYAKVSNGLMTLSDAHKPIANNLTALYDIYCVLVCTDSVIPFNDNVSL